MQIGQEVNSVDQLLTKKKGKKSIGKESDVVSACLKVLAMKGIFCWRNNSGMAISSYRGKKRVIRYGSIGSPDIIGILPNGVFIGVECKRIGGVQSLGQKEFQKKTLDSCGVYTIVHSGNELLEFLNAQPTPKRRS